MTKAIINNQLVTVKVLKTRKLFWLFEQVLVEYYWKDGIMKKLQSYYQKQWIPKSNLIEEPTPLKEQILSLDNSKLRLIMAELNCATLKKILISNLIEE